MVDCSGVMKNALTNPHHKQFERADGLSKRLPASSSAQAA
jgi:hypothetical protein